MSLTYLQAIVIGLLQGVTELFPISSLGHSVLVPAWLGGSWKSLVTEQSSAESPYLAFIVGLHVATALALLVLFRRDWYAIVRGFVSSLRRRSMAEPYERLSWLIVIATVPVGALGILLEHPLRVLFAKPLAAACFLVINGLILLLGERMRRKVARPYEGPGAEPGAEVDVDIATQIRPLDATVIGFAQAGALLAGISRSGISMVGGLFRGLDHEQAVRFAFLLATPVILAAGVVKIPDLFGPLGNSIRGEVLAGSIAAFAAAYLAASWLVRFFKTGTLIPFAVYSLVFGGISIIHFA